MSVPFDAQRGWYDERREQAYDYEEWLIDAIRNYQDRCGRNSIDDVDLPGLLTDLGIDADQFGEREDV